MNKVRKIIRKIPGLAGIAKVFYDARQERNLMSRVRKLLAKGWLPYTKKAPAKYSVGYEPTIRCNLRCKMCYQAQTRALRQDELTPEQAQAMFEKLKGKTKEIKLVGGEPFVRTDIFDLITFWDQQNIRVILQTNCTLINERNIDILKKFKSVSDILTSLDGPPALHDTVRGVPGSFERFKKAIELLKGQMPQAGITVFATLLVWDNLDKFFELLDVCKSLGLATLNIIFEQVYTDEEVESTQNIFQEVFGWPADDYRLNTQTREKLWPKGLTAKELKQKLAKIRRYGLKKGCFVNFVPFNYYYDPAKYLGEKPGQPFCLKLLSSGLRINQKGEVIWCDVIEKSFGNLLEKSPDEIWLSDEYQKFREYLFKHSLPICGRCCKAVYLPNNKK